MTDFAKLAEDALRVSYVLTSGNDRTPTPHDLARALDACNQERQEALDDAAMYARYLHNEENAYVRQRDLRKAAEDEARRYRKALERLDDYVAERLAEDVDLTVVYSIIREALEGET